MNTRLKTFLRRSSIAIASIILLLMAVSAVLLGTESGTRWVLHQATQLVPGRLTIDVYHGTLLRGLEIPLLDYEYESTRISASDLLLRVSWLRSSLARVYLSQLAASAIVYQNLAPPDPREKPLQVSMPALPIRIIADRVDIASLTIGEIAVTGIAGENVRLRGARITADKLGASAAGITAEVQELDTRLNGDVPVRADISWQREDQQWSGQATVRGSLAELDFSQQLSGDYPASATGKAFLLNRIEPQIDAVADFERWVFGRIVLSDGEVRIQGAASDYRASFDVSISDGQLLSATLAGETSGNRNGLHSLDVIADGPVGQLAANGTLTWLPEFSTSLGVRARDIDPSRVSALATGKLDADLRLQATALEHFSVEIVSLDGLYNAERASANGGVSRDGDHWTCSGCNIAIGPNRATINGELLPDRLAADIDVTAPDLRLLWSELGGGLTANANLSGSVATPVVSGMASATNVSWNAWSATAISVVSRSSTQQTVDLDIEFTGLQNDDVDYGSGAAKLHGDIAAVESSVQWSFGELQAEAAATVAVENGGELRADVHSARLTEPFAGTWQLDDPLRFSMRKQAISVTPHSWSNGEARLNLAGFSLTDGEIEADASLTGMPLATLNAFLPENLRLGGYVDAELRLTQSPNGQRSGGFRWTQRDTVVRITPLQDDPIDIRVPLASADFRLLGDGAEGEARLEIEPGVHGSLELQIDRFSEDAELSARLRFGGEEWLWVSALLPEIEDFTGVITTDVSASGQLSAPELHGELLWQNGRLAIPALNVALDDIDLKISGSSAGSATVAGSAKAGAGTLAVDGRVENLTRSERSFTVRLSGTEATLLNLPDYQLAASPDLVFTGNLSGVTARGKVNVDRAEIAVNELPEGAVTTSPDVSVSGREEEASSPIPFNGEVRMLLSENVHVSAFGLDTHLQGQLQFSLPENREPRAEGELRLVDGVFAAYGQRLKIDEGTMTFTGPLDDPVIFVRAVREIEGISGTIKAGLELRGRAQNLTSTIFSSPSMPEADALSYLILGRPLEDATVADGSMLSGTAYALGLRQASVVTSQIGNSLGLDQFAVAGNNQSTTALVAGKQLNTKLYVRYAYGVFTQIGKLLLRYKLTKRLTIEAGTGSESQSMDLLYSVEKP